MRVSGKVHADRRADQANQGRRPRSSSSTTGEGVASLHHASRRPPLAVPLPLGAKEKMLAVGLIQEIRTTAARTRGSCPPGTSRGARPRPAQEADAWWLRPPAPPVLRPLHRFMETLKRSEVFFVAFPSREPGFHFARKCSGSGARVARPADAVLGASPCLRRASLQTRARRERRWHEATSLSRAHSLRHLP